MENLRPKKDEIPLHNSGEIKDMVIHAHYELPVANFHWFIYEYNPKTGLFFGYAYPNDIENAELGSFSLHEFEQLNENGLLVIKDTSWVKGTTTEKAEQYPVLEKILTY